MLDIQTQNSSASISEANSSASEARPQAPAWIGAYVSAHRSLAAQKRLTPSHMIAYNLARGLDPARGFTPITNTKKLANGAAPMGAYEAAKWRASRCYQTDLAHFAADLDAALCQPNPRGQYEGNHPLLQKLKAL